MSKAKIPICLPDRTPKPAQETFGPQHPFLFCHGEEM